MEYNENLFEELKKILREYKTREAKKCIFDSISDYFYRENYHSDIIAYYFTYALSRKVLIEWINKELKDETSNEIQKLPLHFDDYKENNNVFREQGRRDITIFSNNKKNAIIIENKSNNADDRDHQILNYICDLEKKDITVDAVIYLNKDSLKRPDMSNWTIDEKSKVNEVLICTQLIGKKSFVENIINPILSSSEDIRLTALSLEIRDLFTNLVYGDNSMSNTELQDFMSFLNKDSNLIDLKKMVNAYNEFPGKSRDFYYEYLNNLKNEKLITDKCRIGKYSYNCLFVDHLMIDRINFGVDFWFYIDGISVSLLVRNDDNWIEDCEKLQLKMKNDWPFDKTHEDNQRYFHTNQIKGIEEEKVKEELKFIINSFNSYLD